MTSEHTVHAAVPHIPCLTSATATVTSPVVGSATGCCLKSLDLVSPVSRRPSPHSGSVTGPGCGHIFGVETDYFKRTGAIYRAANVHTKPQQFVALKLQRTDESCPTNRYERFFYPILQGGLGMPTLWASGVDGSWDYLALDLLGSSLHSLFWKSNKSTMDLRSVLCIGMQVVSLPVVYVSRFASC